MTHYRDPQPQMVKHYFYLINPDPAKLIHLNFHLLELLSRYCDPQLQVDENYAYVLEIIFFQILMFKHSDTFHYQ